MKVCDKKMDGLLTPSCAETGGDGVYWESKVDGGRTTRMKRYRLERV